MNPFGQQPQVLVRGTEQRILRDLKRVRQDLHRRGIPIQVTDHAVLEPSIRQDVLHAVGKPHDIGADKLGSTDVRDVKFRRIPKIDDVPDELHAGPHVTAPHAQDAEHDNQKLGCQLNSAANDSCATVFLSRIGTSHVIHGAAVASTAATNQTKNPISPAISMTVSVRDPNVAGASWEANENTPKILGKFAFCEA